ncbi:hypothetical protein GCM10007415_20670 [Parapedobacter pyrenivorans]|uniref:Uncharacterized protein n=2 Tax=Parapedobacter pyrenivorans TaxID=1305674 RepID=A0A917HQD3_9SPHI|nr:hypothetical protein GCM10007415_20670 [Parapedobacter pyrenivorans]
MLVNVLFWAFTIGIAHGMMPVATDSVLFGRTNDRVELAHEEIWHRFIDEYNVLIDFADYDGSFIRPEADEYRMLKPNALAWWTPTENGSMFNGLYLDAICRRWALTHQEADKEKARRLVKGLLFLASVGDKSGFIARSVATDGKTPPAMGSNDQSSPWFYGLWRYVYAGLADDAERDLIVAKMTEVAEALVQTGWRIPTMSYSPSRYRNTFAAFDWEGAPRILFVTKAMHYLTGDDKWHQRYIRATQESAGEYQPNRLEICRQGMHFEHNKTNRWTGVSGVVDLLALWEMESDPKYKRAYEEGLNSSAESAAEGISLWRRFDSGDTQFFMHDWRVLNQWWRPQHSEQDALDVAATQHSELVKISPRRVQELHYMREPIWMSWIVTMAPDQRIIDQYHAEIVAMIDTFSYDTFYYSQFFPVESVWYRLVQGRRE